MKRYYSLLTEEGVSLNNMREIYNSVRDAIKTSIEQSEEDLMKINPNTSRHSIKILSNTIIAKAADILKNSGAINDDISRLFWSHVEQTKRAPFT